MVTVTTKKARIVYDEDVVTFEHRKEIFYLQVCGWKLRVTPKLDEATKEITSYSVVQVGSGIIKKFYINIHNFNGDTLTSNASDIETYIVQIIAYGDEKGHFVCTKEKFMESLKEIHNRILGEVCEFQPKML